MTIGLQELTSEISAIRPVRPVGRICGLSGGVVSVTGLSDVAALGDLVELTRSGGDDIVGEVLTLDPEKITVLPDGNAEGLQINDRVILVGQDDIAPHTSWIGRVIDPFGKAQDGGPVLRGDTPCRLRGQPLNPTDRRALGTRSETGMTAFNTMLPVVRGQRIGLFAGSGVGKTTLLARLAVGLQADVVVIAMIGERGREVREFVERVLGPTGMGDITAVFSVLVAGSDMEEPIADILRGVLDGHVVLDRKIAERGRFPAIDLLRSVSRSLPEAASEDENQNIATARGLLGAYERSEMMIQAGLYAHGSDPEIDAAIAAFPKLDKFLARREAGSVLDSFATLVACFAEEPESAE